jgi:hypothetical protein
VSAEGNHFPLHEMKDEKKKGEIVPFHHGRPLFLISHAHIYTTHNVVKKKGNNQRTIYLVNTSSEIPSMQIIVFKVDFLSLSE